MFKLCVFLALVAVAVAAPSPVPAPAPAPAPGFLAAYPAPAGVLASSSSYINRNYNTLAAAASLYPAALTYGAAYPAAYAGHIYY